MSDPRIYEFECPFCEYIVREPHRCKELSDIIANENSLLQYVEEQLSNDERNLLVRRAESTLDQIENMWGD